MAVRYTKYALDTISQTSRPNCETSSQMRMRLHVSSRQRRQRKSTRWQPRKSIWNMEQELLEMWSVELELKGELTKQAAAARRQWWEIERKKIRTKRWIVGPLVKDQVSHLLNMRFYSILINIPPMLGTLWRNGTKRQVEDTHRNWCRSSMWQSLLLNTTLTSVQTW